MNEIIAETRADGGLTIELNTEFGDQLAIELLRLGRDGIEKDIERISELASKYGLKPHHQEDLRDHFHLIDCFERLIKYYGGTNV
jgi:argininosuccinate synthase